MSGEIKTEVVFLQLKLENRDLCADGVYRNTDVFLALTNQKLGRVVRFKGFDGVWKYGLRPFSRAAYVTRDEAILALLNRAGLGFKDNTPIIRGKHAK